LKVKLLRRVFCVVMCVVILACSSVNVFGSNLYNVNYKWSDCMLGCLNVQWLNLNVPNTVTSIGVTTSTLWSGNYMWTSKFDGHIPNTSCVSIIEKRLAIGKLRILMGGLYIQSLMIMHGLD